MQQENDDDILAESENLAVWRSRDNDGYIYHLEIGNLSLHFLTDEWDELVALIKAADKN